MRNFLFLLCIPFVGIAQADYELEFNSATQDYVEMTNASSVIANSTTFSMSAWVYPQANTTHSGIMGFRNNVDADFYLLQLQNTNNIEARFRNSGGLNYDIVASNILDFGQWQHLAFIYDGSNIHLYKDGVLISSTSANGVITQSAQSFRLAGLDYQNDVFHMNGRLDEVRLWDVALSQAEINSWMCTPIDLTHPNYNNLMGYWRLNDGQGTIAYDQTSNGNNGTIMGSTQWQIATTCFGSTVQPLTYVPDDNFENYLEANGMGDGIALNDNVFTSGIDTVAYLDVSNQNISDLTGIEDFVALLELQCYYNNLTTLDVSANNALGYLYCYENNLATLDVSSNNTLNYLSCWNNAISTLNIHANLRYLICNDNLLTTLNLNANLLLLELKCYNNNLSTLDVRNGNNAIITNFNTTNNPNLTCIDVDDVNWSNANWTVANGNIDVQHYFSTNCSAVAFDCTDSLEVTDVIIDNTNLTMNIAIYNGYNYFLNYPYVAFTIDANGDTIQTGNMSLFGAINFDTTWYNYSLSNAIFPAFPLTMYFVYSDGSLVTDTCILTYNSTTSAITDVNTSSNRKLISIVDVLGRESKGTRNEPLFFIFDDGTVEKQIVIE